MKICKKCKEKKELDKFNKKSRNSDGRMGICKSCYRLQIKSRNELLKQKRLNKNPLKTKKCSKCKEEKDIYLFDKDWTSITGFKYKCKQCTNLYYCKIKDRKKEYQTLNKDKIALNKKRRYLENREIICSKAKEYSKNNREKINKYRKRLYNELKNDPNFKLSHTIKSSVRKAIKKNSKSLSTFKLLGCTVEYLKDYLELKFKDGMTWENHGLHGWHIDHIVPISNFDLADPEQQKKCFHYTNLQPLWAIDNLKKGNKVIYSVDKGL